MYIVHVGGILVNLITKLFSLFFLQVKVAPGRVPLVTLATLARTVTSLSHWSLYQLLSLA